MGERRPVLYEVPASWEAAKNDGERWRFALAEQARLTPA
jgi:alpha-2-macroglobulin